MAGTNTLHVFRSFFRDHTAKRDGEDGDEWSFDAAGKVLITFPVITFTMKQIVYLQAERVDEMWM